MINHNQTETIIGTDTIGYKVTLKRLKHSGSPSSVTEKLLIGTSETLAPSYNMNPEP